MAVAETREISGMTTFGSASDCSGVNVVSPRCSQGPGQGPANGVKTSYFGMKAIVIGSGRLCLRSDS